MTSASQSLFYTVLKCVYEIVRQVPYQGHFLTLIYSMTRMYDYKRRFIFPILFLYFCTVLFTWSFSRCICIFITFSLCITGKSVNQGFRYQKLIKLLQNSWIRSMLTHWSFDWTYTTRFQFRIVVKYLIIVLLILSFKQIKYLYEYS